MKSAAKRIFTPRELANPAKRHQKTSNFDDAGDVQEKLTPFIVELNTFLIREKEVVREDQGRWSSCRAGRCWAPTRSAIR